ncbi:hypothetical protein ACFQ3Z_00880 [Streptomyces nogalater]
MKRTPVVFIHGVWLHALSWESWTERFADRGFLALAPGWPGRPRPPGTCARHRSHSVVSVSTR